MTIRGAMDLFVLLTGQPLEEDLARLWLSELDGRIRNEILLGREGVDAGAPPDYHWQTDANKVLLAEVPYDYLYTYWLFMRIDYLSGETTRFNNSAVLFNTAWMNYANFINRTHPLRTAGRVGGV